MWAQKDMAVRGPDRNRFRIQLYTDSGEPYCRLTVEVTGARLNADEFLLNKGEVDNWDQVLSGLGYIGFTDRYVHSGYNLYPVYRLLVPVEEWELGSSDLDDWDF